MASTHGGANTVTLTLRLDEATAEALARQAEIEHRAKNDVVVLAIRERAASAIRRERRSSTIMRLIAENKDLLGRLAQ